MGQTFYGSLLLNKLRPVLCLVNACSSHAGNCHKLFAVSFWKYPDQSSTWRCTPSAGFCSTCTSHIQSFQCHRSVTSSYGTIAPSATKIVLTSIQRFSSSAEKQQGGSSKKSEHSEQPKDESVSPERLSLFKRFKQMYRDYWYVLIPVHVVTSVGWFGAFYYMCVSGVDVVAALESLNISEKIINPLRDSKAGYVALTYAMYKIATPLRYTVTLGGTTVSINYLRKWGYIKPIPPREKLKEMYDEKKENLIERKDAIIKETTDQLREKRDSFMKSYRGKE